MKLIMESWKRDKLLENIETGNRLSIFDFDETIAYSEGHVTAIDKETGEEVKITTQEEYDKYKKLGTHDFDFSALENVTDEIEITPITDILRDRLGDPNTQVMVLTARSEASSDDIHRAMEMFEPPIPMENIIVVGLAGANKGEYIKDSILSGYPNITSVEFYDDSQDNINDVVAAREEVLAQGNVTTFDVYKIEEGYPVKVK